MELAQDSKTDDQQKPKHFKIETTVMKLVVDSYLHGAQTCEVQKENFRRQYSSRSM